MIKVKNRLKNLWIILPENIQRRIVSLAEKYNIPSSQISALRNKIGYREVRSYACYLCNHFDEEVSRLKKNPVFVKVNFSNPSRIYHTHYITDVIEYTVAAMSKGMIPVFYIRNNISTQNDLCIEWLIEQPCSTIFDIDNYMDFGEEQFMGRQIYNTPYKINNLDIWDDDNRDLRIWRELAAKIIKKNSFFDNYIVNDKTNNHIDVSKSIGVLIRGTDYVKLKPKLHPVQPTVDEVVHKVREVMGAGDYKYIYVATDEKSAYEKLVNEFGEDVVLSNKREYYDEEYRDNNYYQIEDTKGTRENEVFWRSIEYLSSIYILSECKGIIGGNCGGTGLAFLLGDYKYTYIFNKGLYK